jgi:hypothetical protein
MAILAETSSVKFLTQINTTIYDDLITTLEPIILDDITNYTQNYFIKSTQYFWDNTFSFLSSGCVTCSNTSINFNDFFMTNSIIYVHNSIFNDGYYSISNNSSLISSSFIYVNETINNENSTSSKLILITKAEFPKDLVLIASRMIKHLVTSQNNEGIKSESLGDHSITYTDIGSNSYPVTIANGLKKYRKVRFL